MAINKVLVVGATGHLGRHFVPALRKAGKQPILLVRPETIQTKDSAKRALLEGFVTQGARILPGSIDDPTSMERACAEADAVISTVTATLAQQPALAAAAKKSGRIQRFIPSEFGVDPRLEPGACTLLDWKAALQPVFAATGIPLTYVYSNGFASYWAAGLGQLGLTSPPREQINVYGEGNTKVAIVVCEDIARSTVLMLDDARTENRHVAYLPKDNLVSQNEMIAHWEKTAALQLKRNSVPASALDVAIKELTGKPERMMELIYTQLTRAAWILGIGSRKQPDALEITELYPDFKFERPTTYLDRFLKN